MTAEAYYDFETRPDDANRPACLDEDPEIFYPNRGEKLKISAAKLACQGCGIREQCLDDNLLEPFGIWGGLTESERRRLVRQRPSPTV